MADKLKRSRDETHQRIRQAIVRIENNRPRVIAPGRKISIAAVAEEAGVSRTLIHNLYLDLLSRIRGGVDKAIQSQRDEKHALLKKERGKNRELRQVIAEISEQRDELASRNATLEMENRRLTATLGSSNVMVMKRKD